MTGKLDEISRVIGNQEANLAGITQAFRDHCRDDDDRHAENIATLKSIDARIAELTTALAPLARTISAWQPIIEGYQISRWKLAGAVSLAAILLTLMGWILSMVAGSAIKWLLQHFH